MIGARDILSSKTMLRVLVRRLKVASCGARELSVSAASHDHHKTVKSVTVVGSGLMGAGIAQVSNHIYVGLQYSQLVVYVTCM